MLRGTTSADRHRAARVRALTRRQRRRSDDGYRSATQLVGDDATSAGTGPGKDRLLKLRQSRCRGRAERSRPPHRGWSTGTLRRHDARPAAISPTTTAAIVTKSSMESRSVSVALIGLARLQPERREVRHDDAFLDRLHLTTRLDLDHDGRLNEHPPTP